LTLELKVYGNTLRMLTTNALTKPIGVLLLMTVMRTTLRDTVAVSHLRK